MLMRTHPVFLESESSLLIKLLCTRIRGHVPFPKVGRRLHDFQGAERIIVSTASTSLAPALVSGHSSWVRASHWVIAISVMTLMLSGFVILMAHPRLYWGAVGNDLTPALWELPISRNYWHRGWTPSIAVFFWPRLTGHGGAHV